MVKVARRRLVGRTIGVAAAVTLIVPVSTGASSAATPAPVPVLHSGQIARQTIASLPTSEPDTLVEPHVAVDPRHPHTAVAVFHEGRFPDGGAVDIGYSWTRDGGGKWHHGVVPGLTKAVGGSYDRVSDPVVQFAADGTAYLSTVLFEPVTCPSAVAVSKSVDGGANWGLPVVVHSSTDCNFFDDKNWLVIDNSPTSPHFARIYQFWTAFLANSSPQVLRFSDDRGATWSPTFMVTPDNANTQDSQPMVLADGTVVDTYNNSGPSHALGDSVIHRAPGRRSSAPVAINDLDARRSTDGGITWGSEVTIAHDVASQLPDVRCCLSAANVDHSTGRMYAAWEALGPGDEDPVLLSSSTDGLSWTAPVRVSRGDAAGAQEVNVTVVADRGDVFVTYGTRTHPASNFGFVQQKLSTSSDGGATFGAPQALGPVSVLQWAAQAPLGVPFPGDYIGAAASGHFLYLVWAVSSHPAASASYHQVMWGATLRY